jgi:hypothetical protein
VEASVCSLVASAAQVCSQLGGSYAQKWVGATVGQRKGKRMAYPWQRLGVQSTKARAVATEEPEAAAASEKRQQH